MATKISEQLFEETWHQCNRSPTAVAKILGMTVRGVSSRAARLGLPRMLRDVLPSDEESEPKIQLPVLPTEHASAEEILQMRERETDRVLRRASAVEWFPVRVKAKGPIGILWYGDPHLDDPGCDIRALRRDVELVKKTPGLFAAAIGDLQNNWIGRLARLYGEQQATHRQAWILVEWFVNQQKDKWLMIVEGNHDGWSGVGDPLKWITTRVGAHSAPDEVTLRLVFPCKSEIRVAARHDWPGQSLWNPTHGQLRGGSLTVDADLVIGGHRHTGGYQMFAVPHSGNVCHAVQLGAYKIVDSYAKQKGFAKRHISPSIVTVIDPSAGMTAKIQVFHDSQTGADYLTWLRNRKN